MVVAGLPESGWSLTASQVRAVVAELDRADDLHSVTILFAARFPLGEIVITTGAASQLSKLEMSQALSRHANGEWGDICEEDRRTNDAAAKNGGMVLSVHRSVAGTVFWIITDPGGAATTVLLPDEY